MHEIKAIRKDAFLTLAILLICSEILSVVCLKEILSGLLFFTFLLGGTLLPGMVVLSFFPFFTKRMTIWYALSFYLGLCADLVLYIVVMLLGLQKYAWVILIFISLASGIVLWKRVPSVFRTMERDVSGWKVILLTGAIIFLISIVTYCGNNQIPLPTGESTITGDLFYWSGNTTELTRDFPPLDFRHYPGTYNYYYFSSMYLALVSMATGISPICLSISFTVLVSTVLRVFGGYAVLSVCTDSKKIQFGMLLLFFSTGLENISYIYNTSHMYGAGFGTEYGFASFLFLLYFLLCIYQNGLSIPVGFLYAVSFFVTFGLKSSYACVAICGVGVLCFGWLIKGRIKDSFVMGGITLLLFGVGYYFVTNLSGYTNGRFEAISNSPMYQTYMEQIFQNINKLFPPMFVALPIFYLVFFVVASPVCFAGVVATVIRLTKKRQWESIDWGFLVMFVAGYVVMLQLTMYGLSNMYFGMASFPVAIVWYVLRSDQKEKKTERVCIFLAAMVSVFFFGYKVAGLTWEAMHCYSNEITYEKKNARGYINSQEWEAYNWLNSHSNTRTCIVTNRAGTAVGAITEKYVLENGEDSKLFAAEAKEELQDIMSEYQKRGIEYIVYDIAYLPEFKMPDGLCDVVFENQSTIIYQIR